MGVFQESGVPEPHLAKYVDGLIAVSEAIGQDGQINRIGSIDDRAQVIMNALDAFREEFIAQIEQVEQVESVQTVADDVLPDRQREAGPSNIHIGSGVYMGVGAFALVAVLVLTVALLWRRVKGRRQLDLQTLLERPRTRL